MNIRSVQYFLQIADCGSYSQAARKLYVAQSSLSTCIKKLEEELSIKLFIYDGKSLKLTNEGEHFYNLSKAFVSSYDDFVLSANQLSEEVFGRIDMILPPLVSELFFSSVVADFKTAFPNVEINIANRGGYIAQDLVSVNEFDLAVTIKPVIADTFECIDIIKSPMVLAVPEGHYLERRPYVSYGDLKGESFVSYEEDSVLFQRFIQKTSDAGYLPKVTIKAAETPLLLSLVERGVGILVVPECVLNYRPKKTIKSVRIIGEEDGYQMVLIYKKGKNLSAASKAFIDHIKTIYKEKEEE